VVLLHEAFGVTEHIRSVAERFAGAGYFAVVPELFHRHDSPAFSYDDRDGAFAVMATLRHDELDADLDGAVQFLRGEQFTAGTVGLVGYCLGGSLALVAATRGTVDAAVSFYGGGITAGRFGYPPLVEIADDIVVPWLGLFGDDDSSIPVEHVELLRAAAADAAVPTEIVRYPGAGHAFHNDARPDLFHPEAACDAAGRTMTFLATSLTGTR
jgi:carboxymethylenebutenolidase